jgi:ribosomal protein S18 acetylase RimI-like enzyme
MAIAYRPAHEQELATAQRLVVRSINDLTGRHGFGAMANERPPQFQMFSLKDDPNGLWIAEDGGEIIGFAHSWVAGDLWFLAELFVAPGLQGQGIGNELLRRTGEQARKAGATVRALITFTFNTVSQALYVRHGLLPRTPVYFVNVTPDKLKAGVAEILHTAPLRDREADFQELERIDARALGVSRQKHHRYLLGDRANNGVLLYEEDRCIGYAYIDAGGHIGPLAVADPQASGAAFTTALRLAADAGSAQISAFVSGASPALSAAIAHGMRITVPMVLMSNREFGDWTTYLPRNPGFM